MATYRVHATRDYTVMSNAHLRDKEMSLKAKGLLSVMLSLPETWDYSINGLVAICKENNTAVESALKELKKLGYLVVTKLMPNETESGRIEYVYDIYENPQTAQSQPIERQRQEKQGVENQGLENEGQLSTYKSITNKSIIKESNTKESVHTKSTGKKKTKFTPPTLEEVKAYAVSRNSKVDPVKFFEFYEAGEWIDSKGNPVRNWKQKFLTWESKNYQSNDNKTYGKNGVAIKQNAEDDLEGVF